MEPPEAIERDMNDLLNMVLEVFSTEKNREEILWVEDSYAKSVIELLDQVCCSVPALPETDHVLQSLIDDFLCRCECEWTPETR